MPKFRSVDRAPTPEDAAESTMAQIPMFPGPESPCSALRYEVYAFRQVFPHRRYGQFIRKLQEIRKRQLSSAERDDIFDACLRLVESKKNAKTSESFREQLFWDNEEKKRLSDSLENIHSLSGKLITAIDHLKRDIVTQGLQEKRSFFIQLYEPVDAFSPLAPTEQVLYQIRRASEKAISECRPKGKRGPKPDTELRLCIAELLRVFGDNPTAGYSRKEGRRASPLIDFIETILSALPEEAMTGIDGPYTGGAIEAHVAAVCADLKKRSAE